MDLMIDLETLDNKIGAVLTQIAAVAFDRKTGEIKAEFFYNIDPVSCEKRGMTMNASTVFWWFKQSDRARASLTNPEPQDVAHVLSNFNRFINTHRSVATNERINVWCHSTFDYPIIVRALEMCELPVLWDYRSGRDLRTIVDISKINLKEFEMPADLAHNALHDCRNQIRYLVAALNRISITQGDTK